MSLTRMSAVGTNRHLSEKGLFATVERFKLLQAIEDAPVAEVKEDTLVARAALWTRSMRAADLHRCDWLREMRAIDYRIDCCTVEAWAAWRIDYDLLSPDRKQSYIQMADLTRLIVHSRPSKQLVPLADATPKMVCMCIYIYIYIYMYIYMFV